VRKRKIKTGPGGREKQQKPRAKDLAMESFISSHRNGSEPKSSSQKKTLAPSPKQVAKVLTITPEPDAGGIWRYRGWKGGTGALGRKKKARAQNQAGARRMVLSKRTSSCEKVGKNAGKAGMKKRRGRFNRGKEKVYKRDEK